MNNNISNGQVRSFCVAVLALLLAGALFGWIGMILVAAFYCLKRTLFKGNSGD